MGTSVPPLSQTAPNAPTIVVTPQTGAAVKSAVEMASDAARAAIANAGTAVPPEVVQRPGEIARNAAGHPAGGQFAPSLTKELPGTPPAGGQPTPAAPAPGTEGQQPPAVTPPAQGQPDEDEVETPEQQAERERQEADAALAIETPIMVPGENGEEIPLVLNADTPENAAALQELVALAVSGREQAILLENATRSLQQTEDLRDYAAVDPIGFTMNLIGNDLQQGENLALYLISQPTLFEKIKPMLAKLVANPAAELPSLANKVKADRADLREEAQTAVAENRAVRENVTQVQDMVASLIPRDMPEAQRKLAFRDMLRDLKEYADSNRMLTLPVHQIPGLLRDRMTALGIDPEAAAAAAAVTAARRSGGSTTTGRPAIMAPGARRTPPTPAPRAPAPKPTGKAFITSATRRAAAASIPSGGAGSPTGAAPLFSTRKADGSVMSTEEALAAHRARLQAGQRSY